MSDEPKTPAYQIITQDSFPGLMDDLFHSIESRYVRRSRYIEDITQMVYALQRLGLENDNPAYIDHAGNIVFRSTD